MFEPLLGERKRTGVKTQSRTDIAQDDAIKEAAEEIDFLVQYQRKKCSAQMFFGALLGFCGFGFAFLIGMWKFLNPYLSEFHEVFPSGYGYFPATVSEMVHNPQDPAGKCFFAFEFIGAGFTFMSWYPWELRSVYTGDSVCVPGLAWTGLELSWPMFRQFVPTVGMMLVATVTTTPFAQANPLDYVCISIHLTGAVMLFAGYVAVEGYTLYCSKQMQNDSVIQPMERKIRKGILIGIGFFYVLFSVITGLTVLPLDKVGGSVDVWAPRKYQDEFGKTMEKIVLVDTASGWVLGLKLLSYFSEVMCGVLLIGSFMTIWYFCPERKSDLKDELASVDEIGRKARDLGVASA